MHTVPIYCRKEAENTKSYYQLKSDIHIDRLIEDAVITLYINIYRYINYGRTKKNQKLSISIKYLENRE